MVRFRKPAALLAAFVISISAIMGGAPAANADANAAGQAVPAPSTLNLDYEEQIVEIFDYVNKFREEKGLKPLTFNVTVSEMAEDWSEVLVSHGTVKLGHNPTYATDPRVVDRWTSAGENVAYHSNGSGESIVFLWEMSPAHNRIMSLVDITTMGVGVAITGHCVKNSKDCSIWATLNVFDFHTPPPGTYRTAQDYFDGAPSLDSASPVVVRAAPPVWDDPTNSYTIPATAGVDYYVNDSLVRAGTYASLPDFVRIVAVAQHGYKLLGASSWSHYFRNPLQVTPAPVVFVDKDGTDQDTYTVPSVAGVAYEVGGRTVAAGTYPGRGTVAVTAKAATGYVLTPGAAARWSHTFSTAPQKVSPQPVTFSDQYGTARDTYTIPSVNGIIYQVAGEAIAAGTYPGSGTVTVTAKAAPGFILTPGAVASWTGTFTDEPEPYKPPEVSPFADVSVGQQFYKEMAWLAGQGISTGWPAADGSRTYRPMQPINRDAMAAFLYRAAGSPAYSPPGVSPFADVSVGQQFYKEMAWLAGEGISTGWLEADGSRTYRPMQPINRDAMAAFLYRYTVEP